MHRVSLAIIAIPLILLAATVAISSTVSEDASARDGGRYSGDTSQAASVSNECINPILDSNTIDNVVGVGNCGGTISQQDESGQVSAPITSQTANPDIELQRAITSQPALGAAMTCEDCFDSLTAAQVSEFESRLPENFGPSVTTIEQLCEFLASQNDEDLQDQVERVGAVLGGLPPSIPPPSLQTIENLENCLENRP